MITGTSNAATASISAMIGYTAKDASQNTSGAAQTTAKDILDTYIESFTASYDKTDDSKETNETKEMLKELSSSADTDASGGLSRKELLSIDTSDNAKEAKIVNTLIGKFTTLDKNKDGELSLSEMQDILKQKQFSQQELAAIARKADEASNTSDNSSSLTQKLLDNYTNSYSSKSESSIDFAI